MALDFPANPTNGQVYGSYIYSATSGVWKAREESAAPAVVSPAPPTTANPGDIWVDSSDGISYVRYDDGTSSQWIELISSGVTSLALKADKTYVDSQDALKANLAGATFTGTISGTQLIATTPTNAGSTGGVGIKAPNSGAQTSSFLQFVNNAYTAQWASLEATPSSELKLNASYIKTPSQPTFLAIQSGGLSTTTIGASFSFDQTLINIGGHYNTSNTRFTAPTSGTYHIIFQGLFRQNSSNGSGELTLYKNGSNISSRSFSYSWPVGTNAHDSQTISLYLNLAAGDYIQPAVHALVAGSDYYYGTGLGYFSGRLVG